MTLRFTKMHGAGNDFIVIDGIHQKIKATPAQWRALADRHFGVGADQILVVQAPTRPEADFAYRIYNADGQEVFQCGNGARAFTKFVIDKGLTTKNTLCVETHAGLIYPAMEANGQVTVNMGAPRLLPEDLPFEVTGLIPQYREQAVFWPLALATETRWVWVCSMGNPHAVQEINNCAEFQVADAGAGVTQHPRFPVQANAGFFEVVDRHTIICRVFERGAGETLSCGTGACAAVVCGILQKKLVSPVSVQTRGGQLQVQWTGEDVFLTGPALTVFEGELAEAMI